MFWGTFLARPFTKETAGLFKRVAEAVPAALFSKVGPSKERLGTEVTLLAPSYPERSKPQQRARFWKGLPRRGGKDLQL